MFEAKCTCIFAVAVPALCYISLLRCEDVASIGAIDEALDKSKILLFLPDALSMPLFLNSVVNKYLDLLDKNLLKQKWEIYKSHFFKAAIQQKIQNSKEEQYKTI